MSQIYFYVIIQEILHFQGLFLSHKAFSFVNDCLKKKANHSSALKTSTNM